MRITFLEPQGELDVELLVDALGLVSVEIHPQWIAHWTPIERLVAYDWAMREHMRAGDNYSVRRRPKPAFVRALETATHPPTLNELEASSEPPT